MKLRRWQSEAINAALNKYQSGEPHFLCLATPGAGKTLMASMIAKNLITAEEIDLVLCFSPSVNIATSLRDNVEQQLNCRLDGKLGSKGFSLTYQSMLNIEPSLWSSLLTENRVLVIFDEIHHCAGNIYGGANAWGQTIIQHIQNKAIYTLALTGTPWRSDRIPIVLSSYCQEGKIQCDYSYGLDLAIKDGVCRVPKITAVDNENIQLKGEYSNEKFESFSDFLKQSGCSYQHLLENKTLISHLLKLSEKKLKGIRQKQSNAAGLIVAASVEHAMDIACILERELGEKAYIVTYMHDNSQETIRYFRNSTDKWIISVGMISEGTDIPRLRVCCHLTRVKTELYFRQVMGRVLRSNGKHGEGGYIYMPAEPNLVEYAYRVADDIPEQNTIAFQDMGSDAFIATEAVESHPSPQDKNPHEEIEFSLQDPLFEDGLEQLFQTPISILPETYDATVGLFGRFRQQLINLSTPRALT